jgi:hypothetical protein
VQADKGYTPLKVSDQNMEDDVIMKKKKFEHLVNKNVIRNIPKPSTAKSLQQIFLLIVAFRQLYPS